MVLHDVAVHACGGVVLQIRCSFGIGKGEGAETHDEPCAHRYGIDQCARARAGFANCFLLIGFAQPAAFLWYGCYAIRTDFPAQVGRRGIVIRLMRMYHRSWRVR